jgi:processive 1,2-diacylglycerol beta-glucosyltransferase
LGGGLTDGDGDGLNSVIAFTPYPWEHALVSLRVVRPIEQAGFEVIHGNNKEDIHLERIDRASAILIQREFVADLDVYKQILSHARATGKPVIYEIDDLLLELPDVHPDRPIHYYTPSLLPMLRAIVEADLVTTSTPVLAGYYRTFNQSTVALPNCLDDNLWPIGGKGHCRETKGDEYSDDHPLTIGYMGSNTHLPDLQSLTPVFQFLLDRYGEQIQFHFWGGEPPEQLRMHPLVEWTPLQIADYARFADFFSGQQCNIFIAPLLDSFFNRCKSPIKYLEYSAQGVPGVYSKVDPYDSVIEHGRNGLLASTLAEWELQIQTLIENPALRQQIGQNARQDVLDHWLLSQHANEWRDAYLKAQSLAGVRLNITNLDHLSRAIISISDQTYAWQKELQSQLAEKDDTIQSLQLQLSDKEGYLQTLTHSSAWSLVRWLWRIRLFLSPHGSRRESYLKRLLFRARV